MDRFQRLRELGRGSYGSAVLVRECRGGKQLRVIKEIDTSRLPAGAQREVHTEVGVLKSLSHPNIVAYCDAFFEGTRLCIVMEYADGGDLAAAVKERASADRRFPEAEVLSVFAQCCLALRHVHSKHILHRDLKTQNIFMTAAGSVKLGDFGVARVLDHTAAEAQTMIGTPIYLAPEVCNSKPYGTKADVWSLGVVSYELCALRPPFQGGNIASLCMKIMRTEPEPLPELYSEEARGLVAWMLRKSAEGRPSIEQLLAQPAVRRAAAQLPGAAAAAAGGPDALDGLLEQPARQQRAPSAGPPPAAPSAAPSPDLAAEFRRNRELAAMLKARAEGGPSTRPPGLPRSQSTEGPPAPGRGGDKAAEEQRHLQALQDAAAQARRDRRQVQQRMRELEQSEAPAPPGEAARPGPAAAAGEDRGAGGRPRSRDPAAARQLAEEEHLHALQEAAAQARRDRRQVQQRVKELERAGELEAPAWPAESAPEPQERGSPPSRAAARQSEEQQHLQALQEAAAQARRERKALQQKMRELDQEAQEEAPAEPEARLAAGGPARAEAEPGARRGRQAEARADQEAEHLRALQEAAAEARRERRLLQQRRQSEDLEAEAGARAPGAEEEAPPRAAVGRASGSSCPSPAPGSPPTRCAPEQRPQSRGQEHDRTQRRTSGRSSLSFAGGLLTGSQPGSRAASADAGRALCAPEGAPAAAPPAAPLAAPPEAPMGVAWPGAVANGSAGPAEEAQGSAGSEWPLDARLDLTRILPRQGLRGGASDQPAPLDPALRSRASTPLVDELGPRAAEGSTPAGSPLSVGADEGRQPCPPDVDSAGNHTLGSSLFSYTATGTLTGLSCVVAP